MSVEISNTDLDALNGAILLDRQIGQRNEAGGDYYPAEYDYTQYRLDGAVDAEGVKAQLRKSAAVVAAKLMHPRYDSVVLANS